MAEQLTEEIFGCHLYMLIIAISNMGVFTSHVNKRILLLIECVAINYPGYL